MKRRAAAMLAWPAKGKLVKLAKACLPPAASRTAVLYGELSIAVVSSVAQMTRRS